MSAVAVAKSDSVKQSARSIQENALDPQQTRSATQEDIARLAYMLWQHRGYPDGSAELDWFEAELQLNR